MAIFVYETKAFLNDVDDFRYRKDVDAFKQRVEMRQSLDYFDKFPPPYYKKRFERQIRLVSGLRNIDGHYVVCFYRMFTRASNEYAAFVDDPVGFGKLHLDNLANEDEIRVWLKERTKIVKTELPKTSSYEQQYLWSVQRASFNITERNSHEYIIYESHDWVKEAQSGDFSRLIARGIDKILDATSNDFPDNVIDVGEFKILAKKFSEKRILFLIAPYSDATSRDALESLHVKYADILSSSTIDLDTLIKRSGRAYPDDVLLDGKIWTDIEGNASSSIALSPEESDILISVHKQEGEQSAKGFPLFVNGGAGSGKSTILQYLFADYIYTYLYGEQPDGNAISENIKPAYFACSKELIERAKAVVSKIVSLGAKKNGKVYSDPDQKRVSTCFFEFRRFLLDSLPPERRAKFKTDNQYTFSRFRAEWEEKYGRAQGKRHSAELAWHVIRTYIKGFNSESVLAPDDYTELPELEKSVEPSTYKSIYENEWGNWYGRKERADKGYWDDQDLAREVISAGTIGPMFLAVFCDEVQDFTRIELELLFHSSIFTKRKLDHDSMKKVPFTFVGDPFQTINPTGFRWEAVTSSFTEKYRDAMRAWGGTDFLNRRQLQYNYRSDSAIVSFANYIQFVRMRSFNLSGVLPQIAWFEDDNAASTVAWFSSTNAEFVREISRHKDIVIIVPCEEGEEGEFVRKDPNLRAILTQQGADAAVPTNVMSPARVKGMEFDRVLIYGFSETGLKQFGEPQHEAIAENRERRLPYEYFLNKLYVAATRAKRKMFIVDSEQAIRKYWATIENIDTIQTVLAGHDQTAKDKWSDDVLRLSGGQPVPVLRPGQVKVDLIEDDEKILVNRQRIAEQYLEQGMSQMSAYFMRQAAAHYLDLKNLAQHKKCIGYALYYEKRWIEAGHAFKQAGEFAHAREAFWRGAQYKDLCSLRELDATVTDTLQYRFSSVFCGEGWWNGVITLFGDVCQAEDGENYSDAVNKMLEMALNKFENPAPSTEEQQILLQRLDALMELGASAKTCALICYRAKKYQRAVEIFETVGDTSSREYQSAKAVLVSKNPDPLLIAAASPEILSETIKLLVPSGSWREILKVGEFSAAEKVKLNVIAAVFHDGPEKHYLDAINLWLAYHSREGAFNSLLPFFVSFRIPDVDREASSKLSAWAKDNIRAVVHEITRHMAKSDHLAQQKSHAQDVSTFLRKWYIDDRRWVEDGFSFLEAGAAIERAGRDIDSLQFYMYVATSAKFNTENTMQAKLRWLRCKVRQFSREKSEGRLPIAQKNEKEFIDRMEEWGMDQQQVARLPEYPIMSHASATARRLLDRQPQEIDGYVYTYNQTQGRVQVTKDAYSLVIILPAKEVKSLDLTVARTGSRFACTEWGLVFDLDHGGTAIKVYASDVDAEGFELLV